MIDGLQHEIGHVLDDAGVEGLTPGMLVKAWAGVAQTMITIDEIREAAARRDVPALIELIEKGWENLGATRENISDGNEEALTQISASGLDPRVKTIANEGRLAQDAIYALGKNVREDKLRPAQWDEPLRLAVDQAMKIRGAEMRTGLIQEQSLGR